MKSEALILIPAEKFVYEVRDFVTAVFIFRSSL
jgi:hypothetical protein